MQFCLFFLCFKQLLCHRYETEELLFSIIPFDCNFIEYFFTVNNLIEVRSSQGRDGIRGGVGRNGAVGLPGPPGPSGSMLGQQVSYQ